MQPMTQRDIKTPLTMDRRARQLLTAVVTGMLVVGTWGCGSAAASRAERQARLQDKLARNAVVALGPEIIRVTPGDMFTIDVQVRVIEGFYVVAHGAEEQDLMPAWIDAPKRGMLVTRKTVWPKGGLVELPGRSKPLPSYDKPFIVGLTVHIAPGVQPGDRTVTIPFHYQQCTVRGCEVPRKRDVRVSLEVLPKPTE